MRPISYISLFLIIALSFSFPSCQKDEDEPTPTGDDRDAFVGNWKCQENSSQAGTNPVFNVSISKSTSATSDIYINNFYNFGTGQRGYAIISGKSANIPSQNISGNTVTGNGMLMGSNTITMDYIVFDGNVTDSVRATFTKL